MDRGDRLPGDSKGELLHEEVVVERARGDSMGKTEDVMVEYLLCIY